LFGVSRKAPGKLSGRLMSSGAAIVMPKLGLTMTEGLLASWRVGPGDRVNFGDVLFVVETEKVATDIEAPTDGQIESVLIAEGETVPVGTVVATWAGSPAAIATTAPESDSPTSLRKSADPTPPETANTEDRIIATPHARKRARHEGVALRDVVGSGPRGRIKAADIEAAVVRKRETGPSGFASVRGVRSQSDLPRPSEPHASRRPANPVEKVVARRLTASKQMIPHFYVFAEADVTRLLAAREELNGDSNRPRLSITHFVIAAVAHALAKRPEINVLWQDDEVVTLSQIDIGLAVDTERGLMAPVLRDLGGLGLDAIAVAATELVRKARNGRLDTSELEGGAVAISNVGMYGASHLVPIINPRQSAVIGVAAVRPVFRPDQSGAPKLCQELGLVFSGDHRVLDGVRAARFLDAVIHCLEHPLLLLR
jgi:pyruvate dehydrogenase E2 component (dihydrolipoamide acetyltransferase)